MAPSDEELGLIYGNATGLVPIRQAAFDGLHAVFEAGVAAERERIAPYRQKWEEVIAAEGFEAAVEVYARQYHDSACIYQKQIAEAVAAERERAARIVLDQAEVDAPSSRGVYVVLAAEIRGDREPEAPNAELPGDTAWRRYRAEHPGDLGEHHAFAAGWDARRLFDREPEPATEATVARREVVWGVVLDDFGSIDYYDSEEEARESAHGAPLARITTEFVATPAPSEEPKETR